MAIFTVGFLTAITLLGGGCVGDRDACDLLKTWIDGDALHISGMLNRSAHFEIVEILDENPQVRLLVLENIPGTLNAAATLQTAALIHERGLDTHLPASGFIESGGVDLFCGGKQRTAVKGSHVGVHSWWGDSGDGADLPKTHPEHQEQRRSFRNIGCPLSFYTYTLHAAPGHGMYIMTGRDLLEQGVVTKFVKHQPD